MKKIYSSIFVLLLSYPVFSQHFNKGFDMSFNDPAACTPRRDMPFNKVPYDTTTFFTGGTTACSGGMKHLTKIKQGGASQTMMNFECGSQSDIDFGAYPYVTIKIMTTCNNDVPMSISVKDGTLGSLFSTFTVKGDGLWHICRLDFGDQAPIPSGTATEMTTGWNELVGTTYPYEIYIDYIWFGGKDRIAPYNTGDPDTAIKVTMNTVESQMCEKDAGEQSILLSGISNGADVSLLSLSQTNTKATIFEGAPAFTAIQPDGTAAMNYTPKAGSIGSSTVHLVLKYDRDTVVKYKSIWFDINIVADPIMKVQTSVNVQVNQPKAIMSVTNAVNSTGGASNLSIAVTSANTNLVTNLVAEAVKSDGTSKISFIPGQDLCGTDVITAIITDSQSGRSSSYDIAVAVSSATCVPDDTVSIKNAENTELTVMPNPATDVITVTMPDAKGGKLIIVDIMGKTVQEIIVSAGRIVVPDINIENLAPGVYFVSEASRNALKKLLVR